MHFESMGQFAEHLAKAVLTVPLALDAGLERCAKLVEKTAKSEFGVYQPAVGPFQDWAELSESTKEDRIKQGFTENDPLLRKGDLRDTISHETGLLETVIGSTSDIMPYHEFGTSHMPPRPVMGPAAFRNKKKIQAILGAATISGMYGLTRIHPSLGYDMEIK